MDEAYQLLDVLIDLEIVYRKRHQQSIFDSHCKVGQHILLMKDVSILSIGKQGFSAGYLTKDISLSPKQDLSL